MTIRLMVSTLAIMAAVATGSPAVAGTWVWGCLGKVGDQQVAYNHYSLVVVPTTVALGKLRDIIDRDHIVEGGDDPANTYDAGEPTGDSVFGKVTVFPRHDNPERKVTLTEKSSKKISSKSRLICGRDESTDIYRKVYRYQREDEPLREITMQCIEFQRSTMGGRPCN